MIYGILLTVWCFLCVYIAFFTSNKYCFVVIPAHIRNSWRKGINPKNNKLLTIYGGVVFLIIGALILIRNVAHY
jgi:hypothetical protein